MRFSAAPGGSLQSPVFRTAIFTSQEYWGSGGWDVRVYRLEISVHWNHQKSLLGLDLHLWIRPGSSADVNPCIPTVVTQLCQLRSADALALSLLSNSTCKTACKSICWQQPSPLKWMTSPASPGSTSSLITSYCRWIIHHHKVIYSFRHC